MQGTFDELVPEAFATGPAAETPGYRAPTACEIAGVTYRQLDYWARTNLVQPTARPANGSGSQRLYSFTDILMLKIVRKLLDAGVSLQNIRTAIEHLKKRGVSDLTGTTLMSDGVSVYECTDDDVIDLLRDGQAVFGIAVGHTITDLVTDIRAFPSEQSTLAADAPRDELAQRRTHKRTA